MYLTNKNIKIKISLSPHKVKQYSLIPADTLLYFRCYFSNSEVVTKIDHKRYNGSSEEADQDDEGEVAAGVRGLGHPNQGP